MRARSARLALARGTRNLIRWLIPHASSKRLRTVERRSRFSSEQESTRCGAASIAVAGFRRGDLDLRRLRIAPLYKPLIIVMSMHGTER